MVKIKIKTSKNKPEDELKQKAKRWDKSEDEYRQNEDGTTTTHRMASGTKDGVAIAYPTAFPRDRAGTKSHDPKDWIEFDKKDDKINRDTAYARGEVYIFKKEANAKKWAEGEYKKNK